MGLKLLQLLSLIFLVFIFASSTITISHAKRNTPTSSPFDFINQLRGCHKGDNNKGIHQLKAYLKEFGYLKYRNPSSHHANDDEFDDTLEAAIKTYQENYHIAPSGTLDARTVSSMRSTRCGVPDIVNGTNYMKKPHNNMKNIHTVSHFSFFPGRPRWPSSKTHLTYAFPPTFPAAAVPPVARAFAKWDADTHFTFARAQGNQNADVVIAFHRRNHGDGAPFDGRGGVLAHAFAPTVGWFHYDADERWSIGAVPNAFDLETVALHEIGHVLGLGHSSVPEAMMFPAIRAAQIKNLHADDIQGIRALYNL